MMKNQGESEGAIDAIIKAMEYDTKGINPELDEFYSTSSAMLFQSVIGQIDHDKKSYNDACDNRSNGNSGKPKEFLADDINALIRELKPLGFSEDLIKQVRVDKARNIIYSFCDKNIEHLWLPKSKLFTLKGNRKKGK